MWKRWRIRILLFLAVLGPGFITANVDNDSGGILTYSQAGAQYGYTLLCMPNGRRYRTTSVMRVPPACASKRWS